MPPRSIDDIVRPFLGNASAPKVTLAGPLPLAKGDLLRFAVEMPNTDGYLTLVYLSAGGDAFGLAQSRREPAGGRPRFGEPHGSFPGWEVEGPFGQNRLLAIVSGQPLFATPRAEQEPAAILRGALAERLEALRAQGVRVGAQLVAVDTVERRTPPVASLTPAPAPPRAPSAEETRAAQRRAVAEVVQSLTCAVVQVEEAGAAVRVAGLVRRGDDARLAAEIARRGVPREALRFEAQAVDGAFCEIMDIVATLRRPDQAPHAALIGVAPLAKGELLRFGVDMPAYDGHVSVAYLTSSGDVAHLVPRQEARGGARLRFGEPAGAFTGWEIDEPFGTDMILVVASDSPLFPQPRAEVEPSAGLVAALAERLRTLQARGAQIGAQLLPVETIPRR
jgi:serine/threonine-protein kinase